MVHSFTTESRLARLKQLRVEVDREIAKIENDLPTRRTTPRKGTQQAPLPAPAIAIKKWAVERGLIPAVVRGRVSRELADAYAREHGA